MNWLHAFSYPLACFLFRIVQNELKRLNSMLRSDMISVYVWSFSPSSYFNYFEFDFCFLRSSVWHFGWIGRVLETKEFERKRKRKREKNFLIKLNRERDLSICLPSRKEFMFEMVWNDFGWIVAVQEEFLFSF